MSKIICFATLKGGSAKTMNAFNIAGILTEEHKVLLVDVDPQANLTANANINVRDQNDTYTINDIFKNSPKEQPSPDMIIVKRPIPELPNLDILPSSIWLYLTEKRILSAKPAKEFVLQKYFAKHKDYLDQYDYIIMDTNPSMSDTNINAFVIADKIILSTDVSSNSLIGAELFCTLWDMTREDLAIENDNIEGLVISNYNGQSNLAKDLIVYLRREDSFAEGILFDTIIPSTVKLKETEVRHKPINVLKPKNKTAKKAEDQYRKLIKEMKEKGAL